MENNLQTQKAGDGAKQTQFKDCVFNVGLSETQVDERAVSVFNELIPKALEAYTRDAYATANERVEKLERIVLPRLAGIDGALEHFADPAFQFVLRKAQQTAATTEREEDYELLSELLAYHVQNSNNRKNQAAIHKAIEITGMIDNEALCALTMIHAIERWDPTIGFCEQGLDVLDDLYERLMYLKLPMGTEWLDHLDTMGALRLSYIGSMKKMVEFKSDVLNGYVCAGILTGSEDYTEAVTILQENNLNPNAFLIKNELCADYVRLPVSMKEDLKKIPIIKNGQRFQMTPNALDALSSVWDLYCTDKHKLDEVKVKFEELWDHHPALCKVKEWWDSIPKSFDLTQVGCVLAHTNARRYDSSLPNLE